MITSGRFVFFSGALVGHMGKISAQTLLQMTFYPLKPAKLPDLKSIVSVTNQFIRDYNASGGRYRLISCQNDSNRNAFRRIRHKGI
jgi:hypothetical protein